MRIIAGSHRGRPIASPTDTTIRPTSDKVRGAIFNILAHRDFGFEVFGKDTRVLDGFSGSGALGLEALSRGAGFCLFLDSNTASLQLSKTNAAHLKFGDQCAFEMRDLARPQHWRSAPFNLVFLDPPYKSNLPLPALKHLEEGFFITPQAIAVVETHRDEDIAAPGGWELVDSRHWGQTAAHFLLRA